MFGIKILSEKKYAQLTECEREHERKKKELLARINRIKKDLESLREQLNKKIMENIRIQEKLDNLPAKKSPSHKRAKKTKQES